MRRETCASQIRSGLHEERDNVLDAVILSRDPWTFWRDSNWGMTSTVQRFIHRMKHGGACLWYKGIYLVDGVGEGVSARVWGKFRHSMMFKADKWNSRDI